MEFTVNESSLYENVLDDVLEELATRVSGWNSYNVDNIENIYPLKRYQLTLHEGPIEDQGDAVATITVDIDQETHIAEVDVETLHTEQNYGTVSDFDGKDKDYILNGADFTNRVLPPNTQRNYNDVEDGDEYDFEMSMSVVDPDGNKVTLYWIFTATKGDELKLDSFDYDDVDRVELG